ncbi:CDP-glucose 4,6-dehydratase [Methylobacterium sp. J-092]|nr:CDP-glucose 4,6-dehydratase [Methylobacterium sp. J-092]
MIAGALPSPAFWRGRRVLLTGHTGFKGAWLAHWLGALGAVVTGFSRDRLEGRSLFRDAGLGDGLLDRRGDVRDLAAVQAVMAEADPEIVLHLAAQSLVRRSYADPVETYATNVMGTVHVLESARRRGNGCLVLVVTSDKCYENREWPWGYRENEALGGHDPYSASKACAEHVASAYARSYGPGAGLRTLTARAGNVFGGGDWAPDRLIPDLVRGFRDARSVAIRNPDAVRPWQHVLEPLCGYLVLCERAHDAPDLLGQGWNFGPTAGGEVSVRHVADAVARLWAADARWHEAGVPGQLHEAGLLRLDSTRAHRILGWHPRWSLEQGLAASVALYRSDLTGAPLRRLLSSQVVRYTGMPA